MISSLFGMLKLATPDNLPGKIVVSIWNWLVSAGESFVQGLISTVTDAVLGTIRSIAGTIAAVATQIASLIPFGLRAVAVGPTGGGTFMLGSDPLVGSFNVIRERGRPARLAGRPGRLREGRQGPAGRFPQHEGRPDHLGSPAGAGESAHLARRPQDRRRDRCERSGEHGASRRARTRATRPASNRTRSTRCRSRIHRPEVESARAHLTAALLGFVPGILQPFVAAIFAPYISGLQGRLNALLDARGTATAILVYHSGVSPKPSVSASPAPSGACSPNPVAAGTYAGTFTATSSEVIDQGEFGKTVATSTGSGAVTVVVAGDGSVTGTWALKSHFVFDETAAVNGVVGLHDHSDSVSGYTGGAVTGTACNLELGTGTYSVESCVDSLRGDCTGDPAPPNRTPVPGGFGKPSSATPGHVVWRWHYAGSTGAVVVADLTIDVSAAP